MKAQPEVDLFDCVMSSTKEKKKKKLKRTLDEVCCATLHVDGHSVQIFRSIVRDQWFYMLNGLWFFLYTNQTQGTLLTKVKCNYFYVV